LQKVQQTTIALESRKLDFDRDRESITPSHKNAVSELYGANRGTSSKLANIDTAEILKVTSSIDSFSTSIQALQSHINSQLQSISIDKQSLSKSIQAQVQQA
jgi:hypothetical protein